MIRNDGLVQARRVVPYVRESGGECRIACLQVVMLADDVQAHRALRIRIAQPPS